MAFALKSVHKKSGGKRFSAFFIVFFSTKRDFLHFCYNLCGDFITTAGYSICVESRKEKKQKRLEGEKVNEKAE